MNAIRASLFLFLFVSSSPAFANKIGSRASEAILRSIVETRTSFQLRNLINRNRLYQRARLVCEAQLKTVHIPIACFDLLSNESLKAEQVVVGTTRNNNSDWLVDVCSRRVSASHNWRELQLVIRSLNIPKKCRDEASNRLADIHYIDQSDRPADLFIRQYDEELRLEPVSGKGDWLEN